MRTIFGRLLIIATFLSVYINAHEDIEYPLTIPLSGPEKTEEKSGWTIPDAEKARQFGRSINIPGTNAWIKSYGVAKVYVRKDIDAAVNQDYIDLFSQPMSGTLQDKRDGSFAISPRSSLIGVEGNIDTIYGPLTGIVEIYFQSFVQNPSNTIDKVLQNNTWAGIFRGYLTFVGLTIGQTFTNFMDVNNFPEMINFSNNGGISLLVNPQVRYSHEFENGFSISAAIEKPMAEFTYQDGLALNPQNAPFGTNADAPAWPDFTLAFKYGGKWGHFFAAGLVREINADLRGIPLSAFPPSETIFFGTNDRKIGYGGNFSLLIKTWGKDSLGLKFTIGRGVGHYIEFGLWRPAILRVTSSRHRRLQLVMQQAGFVSYQHWWNDTLRTNLVWGLVHNFNPAALRSPESQGVDPNFSFAWKQFSTATVNLLWSPRSDLTFGIEYDYARVFKTGGSSGDMNRIITESSYYF